MRGTAAEARRTLRSTAKVCEGTVPLPWRAGANRKSVSPSDDVSTQFFFCAPLLGDDDEEARFPPVFAAGEDPAVGGEAGAVGEDGGLLGLSGNAVGAPAVVAVTAAVAPAGAVVEAGGAGGASVWRRYFTSCAAFPAAAWVDKRGRASCRCRSAASAAALASAARAAFTAALRASRAASAAAAAAA